MTAAAGSKHHLLVDPSGIPLAVSLTGGNRNDVTQLLPLVDAVGPVRGKVGRPRLRPEELIADRGYDHDKYRRELRARGVKPTHRAAPDRARLGPGNQAVGGRAHLCLAALLFAAYACAGSAAPTCTKPSCIWAAPSSASAIYLPADYATSAAHGRRYPVLYLLHGTPGSPQTFFDAGAMTVRAAVMTARRRIRPMVLVVPFGEPSVPHSDTEWANAGAGRYEDYVLEVVHDVDRRFVTVPRRQDRGLAGLSEGAYGALNIALRHLGTFSVVESWSGYFVQTPTGPFAGAPPTVLATKPGRRGARPGGAHPSVRLARVAVPGPDRPVGAVASAGLRRRARSGRRRGACRFFAGGHDWALWRRQVPLMLGAASAWFSQTPTPTHGPGLLARSGRPLPEATRRRILLHRYHRCLARLRRSPPGPRPRHCRRPFGPGIG